MRPAVGDVPASRPLVMRKVAPLALEVLSRKPAGSARRPALLFVHGAYAAAWCWAEHFLPWFARAGYECHAVSLRGHGASEGGAILQHASLEDYVKDVTGVAASIGRPLVLIGHSMGGAVVQRCIGRCDAAGLALLASVPPLGLWGSALELSWRDPFLLAQLAFVQSGHTNFANFAALRTALFSPDLPDAQAWEYLSRMQPESQRVLVDLSLLHLAPHPPVGTIETLVLGGTRDALFPPAIVQSTARSYDVDAVLLPGLSHLLMLEPRWKDVAGHILGWLGGLHR